MANTPNQIKTIGATKINYAKNTISSHDSYMCANALITRGVTSAPETLNDCFERFPNVALIASNLGVSSTMWAGPGSPPPEGSVPTIFDPLLGITSEECEKVKNVLGESWLGCLWGSPMAPFSCTCPDVGQNYVNYLKLRLSDATFWYTPIDAPVMRNQFAELINHGEKISIDIAGDFRIKPGNVVELKVDNMAAYSNTIPVSILSKKYYVLSVKHTISNSGVHETKLVLSDIRANEVS